MKVAVGGTFHPLHDGHKLLLKTAYALGGKVEIGLTSDEMAGYRTRDVQPYEVRERCLREWIRKEIGVEPYIMKLNDPYGSTLTEDYDYIVVSPETYVVADKINEMRKGLNKKPIKVVRVEYVMAEDGSPISSTRIVTGEIDKHGKVLKK